MLSGNASPRPRAPAGASVASDVITPVVESAVPVDVHATESSTGIGSGPNTSSKSRQPSVTDPCVNGADSVVGPGVGPLALPAAFASTGVDSAVNAATATR